MPCTERLLGTAAQSGGALFLLRRARPKPLANDTCAGAVRVSRTPPSLRPRHRRAGLLCRLCVVVVSGSLLIGFRGAARAANELDVTVSDLDQLDPTTLVAARPVTLVGRVQFWFSSLNRETGFAVRRGDGQLTVRDHPSNRGRRLCAHWLTQARVLP
jgi:hypothetical protein